MENKEEKENKMNKSNDTVIKQKDKSKWISYFKSKLIAKKEIKKIIKNDFDVDYIMNKITDYNERSEEEVIKDLNKGFESSQIVKDIKRLTKDNTHKIYQILKEIFVNKRYYIDAINIKQDLTSFSKIIIKIIKNNNLYQNDIETIKKKLIEIDIKDMKEFYTKVDDRKDQSNLLYDIVGVNDKKLNKYLFGWECKNCTFVKRANMVGFKWIIPCQDLICRVCGIAFNKEEKEGKFNDNENNNFEPNYNAFSQYVAFILKKFN